MAAHPVLPGTAGTGARNVKRTSSIRTIVTFGALGAALALGACSSNPISRDSLIRNNPTPELATLDNRDVDRANDRALARNENLRMLRADWDRFWYVDRPSHLTSYPVR
jgi:hypothetical protein